MQTDLQENAITSFLFRASSWERAGVRVPLRISSILTLLILCFASLGSAATIRTDICVYGGTSGGIATAIQSRRMGDTVVVLVFW
jgi:hypothetical protein